MNARRILLATAATLAFLALAITEILASFDLIRIIQGGPATW